MELKDLNEVYFAAWKNPWADLDDEVPDRDPERDGVLTLQRLLETVADHPPAGGRSPSRPSTRPARRRGWLSGGWWPMLKEFGWAGADSPARG